MKYEKSNYQPIQWRVRQGCVLSPYISQLYSGCIVRSTKGTARLQTGGHIINNIRYVDDTDVLAENGSGLQTLLNTIGKGSESMGHSLKEKKSNTMVESRQKVIPSYKLKVGTYDLRQVEKSNYLEGSNYRTRKMQHRNKDKEGQAKQTL